MIGAQIGFIAKKGKGHERNRLPAPSLYCTFDSIVIQGVKGRIVTIRYTALFGAILLASTTFVPLAAQAPQTPPEPLPLSEYGKLPEVERTAISPSGERIAVLTTIEGKRVISAIADQSRSLGVIDVGDIKVRSLRWIGEDRLLLTTSQTEELGSNFTTDKAELPLARVLPIGEGMEAGVVFANSRRHANFISGNYGIREIDGTHYGFFGGVEYERGVTGRRAGYRLGDTRPHLFKVNLETFDIQKVAGAAERDHGSDWLVGADGEVAFTLSVSYNTGTWEIKSASGSEIANGRQPMAGISLVGLGYDGTSAIYVERGEEKSNWYEIDQAGGPPRPFLDDIDFEDLFFDPATGHLMGYTVGEGETERHVFQNPELQRKAESVRRAFATFQSYIAGFTSDMDDVIVRTSGNGDSGTIFAVSLEDSAANAIAYERTAIGPERVGPISTFEYTAADGMEMSGILTLPPGREAKDLPVVMLPHGGPHSADAPVFDWWAQAFASRGYAVFQPNFRGSTNRDAAFRRAGYGEWGRKMQTDKSDGLAALVAEGIVDPSRACIVGASYGGYAALAGVTVQQGLYKCAVAVAPVSDIRDLYNEENQASGRSRTTRIALRDQLGDPGQWDDVSPQRLAARADAPILLIHGRDDTVVPYSHSTRMADKLNDAGKPHRLVTLDGEDHWLSLTETRQRMLAEAVSFVEEHNPAD